LPHFFAPMALCNTAAVATRSAKETFAFVSNAASRSWSGPHHGPNRARLKPPLAALVKAWLRRPRMFAVTACAR
jgi:hypothetical protein